MSSNFSITSLETARKDPKGFAKLLKTGEISAGGFRGYPKSLRWLNAINLFHKFNDINKALNSIERAFSNRKDSPANKKEVDSFQKALSNYETYVNGNKLSLINSREPIRLELSPSLRVTGQIPIILMKPDEGFSAYFVSKLNSNWQSELKFPIVQNYIAKKVFNIESRDVEVGYIDFYTGQFYEHSFSNNEIRDAIKELNNIGQIITKYI